MRRAAYKPPTLKQYRDAAARYFELLAAGMVIPPESKGLDK